MLKIDAKATENNLKDTVLRIYFPFAIKKCELSSLAHERVAVRSW